ncbi:MAG: acetyltransferase [Cyanobacteria bacterium P01_E01_bin.42]
MSEEQIPISQAIAELEQYRQRLIDDTLAIAKKVKANKKATLARLDKHPEILKIDQMLADLRSKQAIAS